MKRKLDPLIPLDQLKSVVGKLITIPKAEIDQMERERAKKASRSRKKSKNVDS